MSHHLNIEIKAKCSDSEIPRKILKNLKAEFKGLDHQIDTYFKCNDDRLKLREGNIENNLIHYKRSDQAGPKNSEVTLYKSQPDSTLKDVLTNALGTIVVVDKKREIYFIDNVKFHIDDVKDLGSFVEIEAIDIDGSLGEYYIREQCEKYIKILGIHSNDLLSCSYSDMLMS